MNQLFIFSFFLAVPLTAHAGNEQDAYNAIAQASYKQSGIELMVNQLTEKELKKVPNDLKFFAGNMFLIVKTLQERKVTIAWKF